MNSALVREIPFRVRINLGLALLAAVLLLCLFGCGKVQPPAQEDSLIGKWQDSYGLTEYEFKSDGQVKIKALDLGSLNGTYTRYGDKITMEYSVMVKKVKDTYTYRIEDGVLYLNDQKYTKKDEK